MTPADFAWPAMRCVAEPPCRQLCEELTAKMPEVACPCRPPAADDLRARLATAEATNHVLTELVYELVQRNPVNARSILGGTE